jgi:hypothetical protein
VTAAPGRVAKDAALRHLLDRHGDDADSRDDYLQLEAERDASLKMLQSKRARTSNGMIAKAEALREKLSIEDERRHGEIAVSLAANVLRYFGAHVA